MKTVRGFTLIELMITLVIGMAITMIAIPQMELFGREQTAKRLNHDAQILLESMNQYYHRHCNKAVFPVVTEANLRADGVLTGGGVNNPWGGNYLLQIDRLSPRNPQLRVSLVFTDANRAGFVAGFSENASVAGSTVTWTMNSTLSRSAGGIMKQMDREAFGTPLC